MTMHVSPGGYVLHAGEGEALWFADGLLIYKSTAEQTSGGLAVAEITAPYGANSPLHRHHGEDEAWYILDGQLTFWLGDHQETASAGAFVFGPRGVEHSFRVDSVEARFLLFLTPAGFEDFTRACGWPATAPTLPPADLRPKNGELLVDAARTHGLDILEPLPPTITKGEPS